MTFTYPDREKPALDRISLTIDQGEFITLCGPSGCGKTTLLRQLKPSIAPHGVKSGAIYFQGIFLESLSECDAATKIGFVLQSPDNQIVTDKVWHELAFGLESLGMETSEIRLRVAEMASFFGIQTWFHKSVTELSGGQKQLLALASVMALQPSVLILDEPTGQLDPIAASEFLATIGKINRELGVTVVLTEHRLEEALPLSTRAIVMDKGRIIAEGAPSKVGLALKGQGHGMFLAMPTPMRVWASKENLAGEDDCPITVRDGADWLAKQAVDVSKLPKDTFVNTQSTKAAITLDDIWFKYEKKLPDIVKGLSFKANYGEITAILGGNGTGKTTVLSLIADLHKPYRGEVHTDAKVYMLPQNPQSLFAAKSVKEDLLEILSDQKISKDEKMCRLAVIVKLCCLENLLDNHPYDLSGGEQQRAALGKVLLLQPKILLLDEPTKGLDAEFKQMFAAILKKLAEAGTAVVMVSHDIEFCAEHVDRCALFFDGNVVTENTPREFFSGNSFYTTGANRMARHILPEAVTAGDIVIALGWQIQQKSEVGGRKSGLLVSQLMDGSGSIDIDVEYEIGVGEISSLPKKPELSLLRKIMLSIFIVCLFAAIVFTWVNFDGFMSFISGGHEAAVIAGEGAALYVGIMLAFFLAVGGITLTLTWKHGEAIIVTPTSESRPLTSDHRLIVAAVLILLAIPLTIYIGTYFFGDRRYYFVSMLIILQAMLPFALIFESRKPQARELMIIAVLCAIAVAGRIAFFMLPQCKPVIAIVIISGVAFGAEAGFLVGIITGFVSNMFFGQGPWTPWQMFAFGIIGFLAGLLFRKGFLQPAPVPLAVFGAFAAFIIFGGIMNPAAVLIFQSYPTTAMFIAAYLQGIPFDLIHATATAVFLLIIARPMLEKLDRVKVKYGLIERKE